MSDSLSTLDQGLTVGSPRRLVRVVTAFAGIVDRGSMAVIMILVAIHRLLSTVLYTKCRSRLTSAIAPQSGLVHEVQRQLYEQHRS